MKAKRLLTALMIALLVSGLFTFWLSRRVAKAARVNVPQKHLYVAARKPLDAGEALKPGSLQLVEWPASTPLSGGFTRIDEVAGRIVLYPLPQGEPILERQLAAAGAGAGLTASIPSGMRAISVRSDEVVGVAGFLLPGTHVDVLMTYGFTEAKMAWPECPYPEEEESGGFHLYPDLGIVEIVDPKTGESVDEGCPGEIVFTPLDARGTVVLRYRTGDLIDGGLVYEPCPHCGRELPRLVGRISRTSEVKEMHLDKLKGTLIDFNELEHVLDNFDSIGAWQLELRKANDDPLELGSYAGPVSVNPTGVCEGGYYSLFDAGSPQARWN